MKFDEAIKYAKEKVFVQSYNRDEHELLNVLDLDDVIEILENLKKEYAPTVEMTKEQRDLIFETQDDDDDRLYQIMGTEDGYYFDSTYWGDIEPHEVAQAYLHPETIKVVEE